jgi:16S rRNA (guanine966-N2)-methyltransferase
MRVIAGTYRSRTIAAPSGMETRPTGDRLRERLFNILAPKISGARVADLFAGSGAIGIEALSRGAAFVLFAEKAAPAVDAIRGNLQKLGIRAGFSISAGSVVSALRKAEVPFNILFLDPPYEQAADYGETLRLLAQDAGRLLAPDAIVVVEHRTSRGGKVPVVVAEYYGDLHRYRLVEQGEAALSFYRIQADDGHSEPRTR